MSIMAYNAVRFLKNIYIILFNRYPFPTLIIAHLSSSPFFDDHCQFVFHHDDLAATATTYNYAILELPEDGDNPTFPFLGGRPPRLGSRSPSQLQCYGCFHYHQRPSFRLPLQQRGYFPHHSLWRPPLTFRCTLPNNIRCHDSFYIPRLIDSPPPLSPLCHRLDQLDALVDPSYYTYESISTSDDVLLLAKGINNR